MFFEEKKLKSQRIYEGVILNLRKDTVTVPKGQAYREVVEHSGAVAIVPITLEEKIIMIRQYRYPIGKTVLEIPAGKIDHDEVDPLQTAKRELQEETGYTAENFVYLGKISPSVAYTEEMVHIYVATGLSQGEPSFDEDEAIEVVQYPFEEVYKMAAKGELIDSKTIVALFMAKEQFMTKK